MNAPARVVEAVGGLVIILAIFYDLFQTVVLPRPAVRKIQLARYIVRPAWFFWRAAGRRIPRIDRSEAFLAAFGPLSLITLFVVWAAALTMGYALLFDGLGNEFRPPLNDFPTAIYVSATTLVPLSYGDFVPEHGLARAVIIAESATGVAIAALAITLLFSLYESFRSREESVVALDALAGAPPSGVHILESSAKHNMRPELKATFDDWRKWSAMVLESHLAYPLLVYFRSSHDNEAWINSFAAVMDAAALVISSIDDDAEGPARLMFTIGNHLVEDLNWVFRLKTAGSPIIEPAEYEEALDRLKKAGYRAKDGDGWTRFSELRSKYASTLNQIASRLAITPAQWVGDRSYLPHRERPSVRARRAKQEAKT
jgi:ion channel